MLKPPCLVFLIGVFSLSASANEGCDAAVVTYLQTAATQGAKTETDTRSVSTIPASRDVSCLESILSRDLGIWVSFPSFSDIAGEAAKRGCRAVQEAVDGVIEAGSINLGIPGTGISGRTGQGGGFTTNLNGTITTPSTPLLEALRDLRGQ